ncbi:hypothetical protein CCAX7_000810 [Capsulimonas corticalis]|uniref:Uncharacterized protein n=1 Tax=Capsulimonas corticalis TaxID=2219043 RepID=A0A402CRG3_9BACT|nr:CAP domain-containing protein [Capsulimonas corticalis]BDI28030.1 hypothetical protein CCAX7_000810 [Capsulimonas corticalis]
MLKALLFAGFAIHIAAIPAAPTRAITPALRPAVIQSADALEQQIIEKINVDRAARGLGALTVDPVLMRAAADHSHEMCARNYLDHHSPTPGMTTPMNRYLKTLQDAGGSAPVTLTVGENISYCSMPADRFTADFGHRVFMNSPEHRANILQPCYTKVGLGVCRRANGEVWVTEMFCRDGK